MHCLLCKKTQLSKNNRGKSTIFATNEKHENYIINYGN